MVEVTDKLVRKLTVQQRALIVDHVPGPLPIVLRNVRTEKNHVTAGALYRLGLLKYVPVHRSHPSHTELTAAGREAAAKILAECAEMLVASGALDLLGNERPIDVLRRLKLDGLFLPHEAREVPEAEELDEPRKLAL